MLDMTEEERAAFFPIILCEYEANGGLADEKTYQEHRAGTRD